MKNGIRFIGAVFFSVWIIFSAWLLVDENCLPDKIYMRENEKFCFAQGLLTIKAEKKELTEVSTSAGGSYNATLWLLDMIPLKTVRVSTIGEMRVIPGGMPFGIKMFTRGVVVVGFGEIYTAAGAQCPARDAGLELGDIIITVGGKNVSGNDDLYSVVSASKGRTLEILYRRGGVEKKAFLNPLMARDNSGYKAGMWVRDSTAGIGTVTYINERTHVVAGLGHGVTDVDTGVIMPVDSGELVSVQISGAVKGQAGAPGELSGMFVVNRPIATLERNCETGVYGKLLMNFYSGDALLVGLKQEIHEGPAFVLVTVDGNGPRYYDANIERINISDGAPTKNLVIKITDDALIQRTGGIVQGMSGSPIIQNGKIIGAITHVFVNEPTKGYGIFIENMLANEQYINSTKSYDKAS
ncbi:MAG: SpoIVB peptidase [Oscillospiraceae bacterium]